MVGGSSHSCFRLLVILIVCSVTIHLMVSLVDVTGDLLRKTLIET